MSTHARRFRPREGAILDLDSLQALSDATPAALRLPLAARWPTVTGLILEGLELRGEPAAKGPPGTVHPDPQSGGVVVSPGRALVQDDEGVTHLIEVTEPLRAPWPTRAGAAVKGSLVLTPEVRAEQGHSGLAVARDAVGVRLGFLPPDRDQVPHVLPIATALGDGRSWATDIRRLLHPHHPVVRNLIDHLNAVEKEVWGARPEGSVWDRNVFGEDWVRLQITASGAVQAARSQLSVHPMTTAERVRTLTTLYDQLRRTVSAAATVLLQRVGAPDQPGPYRAVLEGSALDPA